MQFDMFAEDSGTANLDASPPILGESAAWMPPETIAFNDALRRGSLADAVAITKPLKLEAFKAVLLASGFSLPATNDRRSFLFLMQGDIVEAARKRVTGRELLDARRAEVAAQAEADGNSVAPFNPDHYARAFLPNVEVGDFVTHTDGFNYVVESLLPPDHPLASNGKLVQAIRPMEGQGNKRRVASLHPDDAKLAKMRYEAEKKNAVKINSPALATSNAYSDFIRENSELSEGQLIRFNDAIYEIETLRGTVPYTEVGVKRHGGLVDGIHSDAENLSLSHREARAARRAFFPEVASFDEKLAKSELAGALGDVIRRGDALNVQAAGELKPGSVIVDENGVQYLAFSARFGYLEAFPFGADGKPAVFSGNQIYFHLDPATAAAYPGRRHDPIYVVNEITIDNGNVLMQNEDIHDADIAANKQENGNDRAIDGSEGLRPGTGAEDRNDGGDSHQRGEPVDAGVAPSGGGLAGDGDVPGLSDGPSGTREGHSLGGGESAPPEQSGNFADARGQRGSANGGIDRNLNSGSTAPQTREQLNTLLVTDMTDEQLLQARVVFADHRRSESIERQIQKRGLDQAIGASSPVPSPEQPKTVQLPTEISKAIAADMDAQKARYMRLQSIAKRSGNTLEQRLALQEKAKTASVALRNMRLSVFAVEDAAVLAIEAGQSHLFHAHAVLFPKSFAAVSAHVAALSVSVTPENPWDGLPGAVKTEVLKRSGWVTNAGELNFVGKRLLNELWAEIHEGTKATITRNLPAAAVGMDSVATGPQESAAEPVASLSAPAREFRDPDTLNALVNPILDGDWFKLGAEEWQARNGYSGRGWSLVKDRSLHPVVRNLDSQVDFMRSAIEASELARATPLAPAGEVQAVAAPVASVSTVAPAAVVDRDSDAPLLTAARLLAKLTNGRNDIWMLAGRDSVQQRVQLMAALQGREKVAQAEAGVTAIRAEFYKRAGIDTNTTPRGAELAFQAWVEGVAQLQVDALEAGGDATGPVSAVGGVDSAEAMGANDVPMPPAVAQSLADDGAKVYVASPEATRFVNRAAQAGMFDEELKAEFDAINERQAQRFQAGRDRLHQRRLEIERDTSVWAESEFAPRIKAALDSLREAGPAGDEMRAVITSGFWLDAKNGQLTEEKVAFRESVVRRELAKISIGDQRPSTTWQMLSVLDLTQKEPDIGKLPAPIVDAALVRLNEAGRSLAKLGFQDQYEVDPTSPKDAQEVATRMRDLMAAMLLLAPIRERIAKGHKNAKQSKLDRMEDFATETIGIDTRSFPGVNSLLNEAAIESAADVGSAGDTVLPADLAAQLQEVHRAVGRGVTHKQALSMRERLAGEIESGTTNNGGVVVHLTPAAVEERRLSLARVDQDLALFSKAIASVGELSPVAAEVADKQDKRLVEQKIRDALSTMGSYPIGVAFPLPITHNNVTVNFMARVDRVPTDGNTQAVIHLASIKRGRLLRGDDLGWIMNRFKLNQKNELVEEGIPSQLTDEEARKFEANFAQPKAAQTEVVAKATEEQAQDASSTSMSSLGGATAQAVDDGRAKEVWTGLSHEVKAEILKRAGFVNTQGNLSFVGTRLAGDTWKAIRVHPKAKNEVVAYIESQSPAVDHPGSGTVPGVDVSGVLPDVAADTPALASVSDQQNASALDAAPVAEPAVPKAVRDRVQWALARMADVQSALVGVEKARGDGAILALEWADQVPNLVRPREILDEFRKLALDNGVDAEEFLKSVGGVPDFSRFEAAPAASLAGVDVSVEGVTVVPGKQPWELSASEFGKQGVGNPHFEQSYAGHDDGDYLRDVFATHERLVKDALAQGLPVPPNVLSEYPELKQGQGNASQMAGSLVGADAGAGMVPVTKERSLYPFGRTDLEHQFFGSIVRVVPELRGDTAWEGEVGNVLNGGRLIEVKRTVGDSGRDYMSVRISGDRIEVLSLKDSQTVLAETDANIGRTWNTVDGKATITALLYPKRDGSSGDAMYEYTNEKGALFRVYERDIEETIQRNEFDASPEGIARKEARELAYQKAQVEKEAINAKMAEVEAHDNAKLAPFFASTDYPALKIGQAKKALLTPVRLEGQIMKVYEFAETLAGRGLKMEIVMEDRIKPMGRMAAFRADNRQQAAHEQRIKEAGKKKVHYIGGFEVGAFEFAYASFVRERLHLEQAAGIPLSAGSSVADPEIDRLFTGGSAVDVPAGEGVLNSLVSDGVEGTGAWSAQTHVQIAADDVSKLRRDDVYRLFEELPKEVEKFDDLRVYLVQNRPDLLSAVVDAIDEVGMPARPSQNEISNEQKAAIVSAQHAKARQVMDFLARGETVRLATQTKVLELHSASQIKLGSDGVYVAEGADRNSSDGMRWVFLFDNQVNALASQVGVSVVQSDVDASPSVEGTGSEALHSVAGEGEGPAVEVATDYEITDDDAIGQGGLGEKFRDNLKAIEIVRVLEAEKRHAVPSEKRALARYVGWGGLKGVFDPGNKQWEKQRAQLRAVLSDAEWSAASSSQLNAHYTSPIVVNAMYSGLSRLGFAHGRMLEPSVGVGNFFGMMPISMRNQSNLHGVELDILTSQIVSALYPSAKISKATGFQDYGMPAGYFDVVIGNPPFGRQILADEKGSAYSGWTIHNYFFAKSIEMLRPGGIMPMVVSHNFLDKLDPHVRQWIARRAELVSGVRLPNTAFKENANTEVVTDILIFKRLDYEHSLGKQEAPEWLETTEVPLENAKTGEVEMLSINNYFLKNPQNVLGTNSAAGSMYRANEYTVLPNGDLEEQLARWVETLPEGIYMPLERSAEELESSAVDIPEFVKEGSFFMQGGEVWKRHPDVNGEQRATIWEAPNNRAIERMVGMIEIRDALRLQMKYERASSGVTLEMIENNRSSLNRMYDAFQKKNGYLNDGVNRRIFMDDTESALIQALEFDYENSIGEKRAEELGIEPRAANATKADIFKTRVLFPPGEVEVVQTAKDALLHSLNFTGGVDMEYMQQAYGKSESEIVQELGDLLYLDPVNGLVTADLYLSGDVKTKLKEARKAAVDDISFSKNVDALMKVQPLDKLPSEIHVTPGSSWVPESIFGEFAREISGGDTVYNYVKATGQWLAREVNRPDLVKNHVDFGTQRIGAVNILNLLMNSRAPEIKEKVDGKYVTDQPATEAARQKADKIRAHWDSWIWADPDRAEKLASIYNDKFNRTVERTYDGSHLTFPGMSPAITLLSHQKNGVWRGLQDRTILLDQVVGAGKTYEGVAMLMEMRRLGITKKPLIAVPNHLTLQWRSDFYRLYPGANVLAATPQDFEKDNRERFFSKVVTGNWDAVIVGHSSLKKIPVPLEAETKIIKEQYDDITQAIEEMKTGRGDRNAIRDMETIKINLGAKISRLKEKGGKKDDVVNFEDLGVDALFVDEMHEFKNLFFTTQMNRVSGLGNPAGSGKAFDMFVKVRWLRETYGENSPLITATGTPVSNSLAEMFTMQRYMQYDKLKENGLHVFDAWAKQYGDVQTVYEVAPSGNGYRLSQRFAKFKNLPSLMGEYRSFADVVTLDDLKAQEIARGKSFPVPIIEGGKPTNIVAQRSTLQEKFFGIPELRKNDDGKIVFSVDLNSPIKIDQLENGKFAGKRLLGVVAGEETYQQFGGEYETKQEAAYAIALAAVTPAMHIDPDSIIGQFERLPQLVKESNGMINALSLTTQANKAGLDFRLINPSAPDFPDSKVNQAIKRIVEIGKKWEDDKGTQLIFCDLSVPLSAQAKMASKEKRVYVRDDGGNLTHKTGTLHSLKENSGAAYFVVADGKGKSKTFSIFDSHTGQLMKDGLDSKADAHEFVKGVFKDESRKNEWYLSLEKSRHISAEEIDEYKNESAIDTDIDTLDQEISLHDIEGVSGGVGFSIYDDMKAKLIANGVPATQIEFIHDHDTPQSKAFLFKRVNDGDVRYLFGSTPKMGAGTNVQKRLVALHHIDAPWRPSDLEQREGRIVRRGNELYERDPEGFRIEINRYATSQTYDTRRWQLLEHKASGVEQLRKYSGANEIEDVSTEAANSADMKAAASGNPLILKETQLANEVKTLRLLYRAHQDGEYLMNSKARSESTYANTTGPHYLEKLKSARSSLIESAKSDVIGHYGEKTLHNKEDLAEAMNSIAKSLSAADNLKVINYRGLNFGFQHDHAFKRSTMVMPVGDVVLMDNFSPSGAVTRMNNWCASLDNLIDHTEKRIAYSASLAKELQANTGKPFPQLDLLSAKVEEHGKVQRALMKSNSVAAVKPENAAEFNAAVQLQKQKLREYGLGAAVDELEMHEGIDSVPLASVGPDAGALHAEPDALRAMDAAAPGPVDDGIAAMQAALETQEVFSEGHHALIAKLQSAVVEVAKERAAVGAVSVPVAPGPEVLSSVVDGGIEGAIAESADPVALPGLDGVKARMVDALPVDVPEGWILMNAPRPLLGQKTMEGAFVSGRHYAALDPDDSMTPGYLKENVALDARLVVAVPREVQMEVALHGNEYRDRYMEFEPEQRFEMLSSQLENLRDLPFGELKKAVFEAKGGVESGIYSGKVLGNVAGVVAQNIGRFGAVVHHDASKLSKPVRAGDVVNISYQGGKGVVSGVEQSLAVGR